MSMPRSAKDSPFLYSASQVCYLALDGEGRLTQVGHDFRSAEEAYRRAAAGEIRLYAVWPGQYHSDLLAIDDLNAFADAFGVERPDDHVHDLEWKLSPYDDGTSRYADVHVIFRCGCTLGQGNIRKFSQDMYRQKGWNVAVSKGVSSSRGPAGPEIFTIRVERRTLHSAEG